MCDFLGGVPDATSECQGPGQAVLGAAGEGPCAWSMLEGAGARGDELRFPGLSAGRGTVGQAGPCSSYRIKTVF